MIEMFAPCWHGTAAAVSAASTGILSTDDGAVLHALTPKNKIAAHGQGPLAGDVG
jgi:hypothetical protein